MSDKTKAAPDDLEQLTFSPAAGESTAPQQDAEQAPAEPTAAQIIGGALAAGREVFCMVTKLESPRKTLDDETAQKVGALWGPVLEKHGIDLGRYIGDYGAEIAAAIGTLSIVAAVRRGVMDEIATKEAKPVEPQQDDIIHAE